VAKRNPPWLREELILALYLYFRIDASRARADSAHQDIVALSRLLRGLSLHRDRGNDRTFRNPAGVSMKLSNFLRLDPTYGKKGLRAGSKEDKVVWDEFANDQGRLRQIADALRAHTTLGTANDVPVNDHDVEAPEGRLLLRQHFVRERNPLLVRKKKQLVIKRDGDLRCEACDFSFRARYGELGSGFIECHHTMPLSRLRPNKKTRLEDLVIVCANCHRMLHLGARWLSVMELKRLIHPN